METGGLRPACFSLIRSTVAVETKNNAFEKN
jgi:hypothetical protein